MLGVMKCKFSCLGILSFENILIMTACKQITCIKDTKGRTHLLWRPWLKIEDQSICETFNRLFEGGIYYEQKILTSYLGSMVIWGIKQLTFHRLISPLLNGDYSYSSLCDATTSHAMTWQKAVRRKVLQKLLEGQRKQWFYVELNCAHCNNNLQGQTYLFVQQWCGYCDESVSL